MTDLERKLLASLKDFMAIWGSADASSASKRAQAKRAAMWDRAKAVVKECEIMAPCGAALIADERRRQVEVEGWTADHDSDHYFRELADAALSAHLRMILKALRRDRELHKGQEL
jgi:hypothetical protein